jgi:hypothetical protein
MKVAGGGLFVKTSCLGQHDDAGTRVLYKVYWSEAAAYWEENPERFLRSRYREEYLQQ